MGLATGPKDGVRGVFVKSDGLTISKALRMYGGTVGDLESQMIYRKGVADACTITSGGVQIVSSGGSSINCYNDGVLRCSAGGLVSGGTLSILTNSASTIYSGGTVTGGFVVQGTSSAQHAIYIYAGAVCSGISADTNGIITLHGGASACNITLTKISTGTYGGLIRTDGSSCYASGVYFDNGYAIWAGESSIIEDVTLGATAYVIQITSAASACNVTLTNSKNIIAAYRPAGVAPGYISGVVISAGSALIRGLADDITLLTADARCHVSSAAIATEITIGARGYTYVSSGGTAISPHVSGGYFIVSSGGLAQLLDQHGGQVQIFGTLEHETISGGSTIVKSTGVITSVSLLLGAVQISSGGTAVSATISGGNYYVLPDATQSAVTQYAGVLTVSSSLMTDAVVSGGRTFITGATAQSLTVTGAGTAYISLGGIASDVEIDYNGIIYANNGGTATTVNVNSGGRLIVSSGGTALAVTSNAGASVTVAPGGYIEYT